LFDLLKIQGLGAKKVKLLYDLLGITSVGELEYACKENRLVELKGFGEKTQKKILKNIEHLNKFADRFHFHVAKEIADTISTFLDTFPQIIRHQITGSLRRKKETVKDIDIVISCLPESVSEIVDTVLKQSFIESVIGSGDTKTSFTHSSGISVDLRFVTDEQYPFTIHHFTGSKEHNTEMRSLAKQHGYKLNEYGLFKDETLIPCASEEELFKALGLHFIPAECRENVGELLSAQERPIEGLIEQKDIRGLFHMHTTYSDGANSLEEMVRAGIEKGYSYIGITDHSKSSFYANGLNEERIFQQFDEIDQLNKTFPEFKVFKGIECDILHDGSLDYSDDILEQFDFIIASVHQHLSMDKETATKRLIKAIEHPSVTMVGHLTGRLLLGREGYPLDMMKVIDACAANGTMIELNCNPHRLDIDWRYLLQCREKGVRISINPDAHTISGLDDIQYGIGLARKGFLHTSDVFNSLSVNDVDAYFKAS